MQTLSSAAAAAVAKLEALTGPASGMEAAPTRRRAERPHVDYQKTAALLRAVEAAPRRRRGIVYVTIPAAAAAAERAVLTRAGAVYVRSYERDALRYDTYKAEGGALEASLVRWREGREWNKLRPRVSLLLERGLQAAELGRQMNLGRAVSAGGRTAPKRRKRR